MAVKKVAAKKTVAKKTVAKKAAPKKAVKKPVKKTKKVTPGSKYACEVCGLVVSVDEECGCIETCDIICCGEHMVSRK